MRRQSNTSHTRPAVGGIRADRETMVTEIADGWGESLPLCFSGYGSVFLRDCFKLDRCHSITHHIDLCSPLAVEKHIYINKSIYGQLR